VPPLRERRDDILTLLEYYVHRYAKRMGKEFRAIDQKTVNRCRSYDWPGNVRELQNIVERSVILSAGEVFQVDERWFSKAGAPRPPRGPESVEPVAETLREREIIEEALAKCRGRVYGPTGAAAKLRVPPSTLNSKIKKLGIRKNRFKLG
jgi:DNA-binding NtrC family response regulator